MILEFIVIIVIIIVFIWRITHKREKNKIQVVTSPMNNFPIYLISMEKDIKRRQFVKNQIEYNYYSAINGHILPKQFSDTVNGLSKGEIACFLSHINMIYYALDNKKSSIALILEDDALIPNVDFSIFNNITNEFSDWDIIFLGYNHYEKTNEKIIKRNYSLYPINLVHGTHGYIINLERITKEKIQKMYPIDMPLDVKFPQILDTFIIEPKLIMLSEFGSVSNTQGIQ